MASLLDELPFYTLGLRLSAFFKILVYFLLPNSLMLILYLTIFLSDSAIACYYFATGNPRWATVIILLMFIPSIGGIMFTLVSPERWPSEKPFDRQNLRIVGIQLMHLFFFPFAAVYRYTHQVFWAVEAMCANYVSNVARRENALRILIKPNSVELYFFLQSFLHSAPQIFFQFYLIFMTVDSKSKIASQQVITILAASLRMAITTMAYQRFERRKVLGAHYPWASKRVLHISQHYSKIEEDRRQKVLSEIEDEKNPLKDTYMVPYNRNSIEFEEEFEEPSSDIVITEEESKNEMILTAAVSEEEFENDDIVYRKKTVSIIETYDKSSNEDIRKNIVDMSKYITPPATPAPRPISFAAIKERFTQNAEVLVDKIPQRRQHDIDLPVRVRRFVVKGVQQEDGVSKFISLLGWFFFISHRMMVLSTFARYYLEACIYLCISHYLLAVLCLMINSWKEKSNRKFFYVFLGYIYIFCILEFKMKFKRVRLWYGLFFALVFIEDFVMTTIWYSTTDAAENWWYVYMCTLIIGTSILSSLCFFVYYLILRPKAVTIYPTISTISISPATA